MRRLSSFWTPFSKWIIPAFLICAFATGAISSAASHGFSTELLLGFCGVVAFIVFLQKVLASDLADEVIDFGDSLFVRRGRLKDRIPLANVLKVETSVAVNPPRMTIYFVKPSAFGNSVAFSPVSGTINPFAKHPLVEELMARAQHARSNVV